MSTAEAAPSASCGQTITRSTTLQSDVGPCPGNGVIIGADNITLNLNGYKILGQNLKTGNFAGVRLPNRTGATVVGGMLGSTISGFDAGVFVNGGSNNRILNLTIRDNVGPADNTALLGDGIAVFNSANNVVQRNVIDHNGIYSGISVLGEKSHGNTIHANTVTRTVALITPPDDFTGAGSGTGTAIVVSGFLDAPTGRLIRGNNVLDNVIRDNDGAGISNVNTADGRVAGNTIEDNGHVQAPGTGIGTRLGMEPESSVGHMVIENNTIRRNGGNGIQSWAQDENQFLNNIIEHNGFNPPPRFSPLAGILVDTEIGGHLIKGNVVHHNRPSGIFLGGRDGHVRGRTDNNRIENNRITNSAAYGLFFAYKGLGTNHILSNYVVNSGNTRYGDMVDGSIFDSSIPPCGNNVWDDNTYEMATPACAGNGGHQVSVPNDATLVEDTTTEEGGLGSGHGDHPAPPVRRGPSR